MSFKDDAVFNDLYLYQFLLRGARPIVRKETNSERPSAFDTQRSTWNQMNRHLAGLAKG